MVSSRFEFKGEWELLEMLMEYQRNMAAEATLNKVGMSLAKKRQTLNDWGPMIPCKPEYGCV